MKNLKKKIKRKRKEVKRVDQEKTTLYPTGTCFDDVVALTTLRIRHNLSLKDWEIVHISANDRVLYKDNQRERISREPKEIAHALIKHGDNINEVKLLNGERVVIEYPFSDIQKHYTVTRIRHYKPDKFMKMWRAKGYCGPWDSDILSKCKDKVVRVQFAEGMGVKFEELDKKIKELMKKVD